MLSVTTRPKDTCATSVAKASTTPLTSRDTYAHIQVATHFLVSTHLHKHRGNRCKKTYDTLHVFIQESVHTSAPSAKRPSPSAAPWSPTWRRSTASPRSTPTRSDATSCTSARSAATRRELRTSCWSTSTRFTPTVPCWRGRLWGEPEEEEREGQSVDQRQALL